MSGSEDVSLMREYASMCPCGSIKPMCILGTLKPGASESYLDVPDPRLLEAGG